MTEPRRATLEQWVAVRMMRNPLGDDLQNNAKILDLISLASCLLELHDRIAALEDAALEAAATPPPAPDHLPDATEIPLASCLLGLSDRVAALEAAATPPPAPVTTDTRDPECVERWPDCYSGGYDPRCCRFPKDCSCGGDPPATESTPPPTAEESSVVPLWRLMHDAQERELADNPMADHSEVYGATIRAVAAWLDTRGDHGSAAALRRESDR